MRRCARPRRPHMPPALEDVHSPVLDPLRCAFEQLAAVEGILAAADDEGGRRDPRQVRLDVEGVLGVQGHQQVGRVVRNHRADGEARQRRHRSLQRAGQHRGHQLGPCLRGVPGTDQPGHLGLLLTGARSEPERRGDDDESPDEVRPVDGELERDRPAGARALEEHRLTQVVLDRTGHVARDVRHRLAGPEPALAADDVDREVARQRYRVRKSQPSLPPRRHVVLGSEALHHDERRPLADLQVGDVVVEEAHGCSGRHRRLPARVRSRTVPVPADATGTG